jgi:hypothetical protein
VPTTPPERSDAYWTNYNGNLQCTKQNFCTSCISCSSQKRNTSWKCNLFQDCESFRMCSTNLLRVEEDLAIRTQSLKVKTLFSHGKDLILTLLQPENWNHEGIEDLFCEQIHLCLTVVATSCFSAQETPCSPDTHPSWSSPSFIQDKGYLQNTLTHVIMIFLILPHL